MTYMHDSRDWLDKHVRALAHVQRDVAQSVRVNPWAFWEDYSLRLHNYRKYQCHSK